MTDYFIYHQVVTYLELLLQLAVVDTGFVQFQQLFLCHVCRTRQEVLVQRAVYERILLL